MRVAVTGASGLLGLTLCRSWRDEHEVIGISREPGLVMPGVEFRQCDLAAHDDVAPAFEALEADLLVHCAAMTDVDACERDPSAAHLVNCEIPGRIAKWCSANYVRLVHVSTDAVFDGVDGGYDEKSIPNPVNVYGKTKLDGEIAVSEALPRALIARINLFGWSRTGSRSLAEFFVNHLAAGETTRGFTDIWFSPLLANDLAGLLMLGVDSRLAGVRHFASRDGVSKYTFGKTVASVFGFDPGLVTPVVSETVAFAAARPKRLTLDAQRVASELGVVLPTIEEGLRRLRVLGEAGYRAEIGFGARPPDPQPNAGAAARSPDPSTRSKSVDGR